MYGTLIDEYGYPLKKYGQLGNGKKDGWYFGDSDKECWFKPKKVMKDVAAVHMGSGYPYSSINVPYNFPFFLIWYSYGISLIPEEQKIFLL